MVITMVSSSFSRQPSEPNNWMVHDHIFDIPFTWNKDKQTSHYLPLITVSWGPVLWQMVILAPGLPDLLPQSVPRISRLFPHQTIHRRSLNSKLKQEWCPQSQSQSLVACSGSFDEWTWYKNLPLWDWLVDVVSSLFILREYSGVKNFHVHGWPSNHITPTYCNNAHIHTESHTHIWHI